MATVRPLHWDETLSTRYVSRVTEDDGVYTAERVRSRLEGWDTSNLEWRRIKVNSSGELVTGGSTGPSSDTTLTSRMLARQPTSGYRMWVDPNAVTNLGAGVIMAEAPTGTATTTTGFRGVFIPTAAGQWSERTAFAWDSRATGWAVA